jgi:hypothetical protein
MTIEQLLHPAPAARWRREAYRAAAATGRTRTPDRKDGRSARGPRPGMPRGSRAAAAEHGFDVLDQPGRQGRTPGTIDRNSAHTSGESSSHRESSRNSDSTSRDTRVCCGNSCAMMVRLSPSSSASKAGRARRDRARGARARDLRGTTGRAWPGWPRARHHAGARARRAAPHAAWRRGPGRARGGSAGSVGARPGCGYRSARGPASPSRDRRALRPSPARRRRGARPSGMAAPPAGPARGRAPWCSARGLLLSLSNPALEIASNRHVITSRAARPAPCAPRLAE